MPKSKNPEKFSTQGSTRPLPYFDRCILSVWSHCISIIYTILRWAAPLSPSIQRQLQARFVVKTDLENLRIKRDQYDRCVVIFCSSAGEYEQAKPLMGRCLKAKNIFVQIVFFSVSGFSFARARNEQISYILAPPDTTKNWRHIADTLRPETTVIVRHEIWPSFLTTFWRRSKIVVIDASLSENDLKLTGSKEGMRKLRTEIKCFLYKYIDIFFVVDKDEAKIFRGLLNRHKLKALPFLPLSTQATPSLKQEIYAVGDTKYDRVIERLEQRKSETLKMRAAMDKEFGCRRWLLIGSAWQADYELILNAYCRNVDEQIQREWSIMIALHEPTTRNIEELSRYCTSLGLKSSFFTAHTKSLHAEGTPPTHQVESPATFDVLIIDKIGILSDLYGTCSLAFVGGAMHYQVHNVLEPASYGIDLAFGPLYKNSNEAIKLITADAATVVSDPYEAADWWMRHNYGYSKHDKIVEHINSARGATAVIAEKIL